MDNFRIAENEKNFAEFFFRLMQTLDVEHNFLPRGNDNSSNLFTTYARSWILNGDVLDVWTIEARRFRAEKLEQHGYCDMTELRYHMKLQISEYLAECLESWIPRPMKPENENAARYFFIDAYAYVTNLINWDAIVSVVVDYAFQTDKL